MKEFKIKLINGETKVYTENDIKRINNPDDLRYDEPYAYLYIYSPNNGVTLPNLVYKSESGVPINTVFSIEEVLK